MDEPAKLGQRGLRMLERLAIAVTLVRGPPPRRVRDELEAEQQQLLLRAVVQVAFEVTAGLVRPLDDATARLLQLGEVRLRFGVQSLVLGRDRDGRVHRRLDERRRRRRVLEHRDRFAVTREDRRRAMARQLGR